MSDIDDLAAEMRGFMRSRAILTNVSLFEKIRSALEPGGVLLVRDHVMSEDRTAPAQGALFALNMLVCTRAGDTYTFEEIERDLRAAGFSEVRLVRAGSKMDALVEAKTG